MAMASRGPRQAGAFVGIPFALIGIGALVGCVAWTTSMQRFIARAEKAQGRVVALVPHRGDDSTTYAPTVEFLAKDGKTVTFTDSVSSNPPSHQEGDVVPVLYDPAKPEDAHIDSFWDLWLGQVILGVLGTVFTLVGLGVLATGLRALVQRRRLREGGLRIPATVEGVENVPGGGYAIVAKATDTRGVPRLFRSATVGRDPGPKMLGRSSVEVVVDPDDWATYEVDLAFLKQ